MMDTLNLFWVMKCLSIVYICVKRIVVRFMEAIILYFLFCFKFWFWVSGFRCSSLMVNKIDAVSH